MDKKSIIKKAIKRIPVKKEWESYPELRDAGHSIDEASPQRALNGYLRAGEGDEEDVFGSKLKDKNFRKALRSFQEDKKISQFG